MPLIIAPEPNPSPDIRPVYHINSDYSWNLALTDYTNAISAPSIDSHYNDQEAKFEYTLHLHIPIQVLRGYEKQGTTLRVTENSFLPITIHTFNYTLAIHIYRQLIAGKDITPDILKDELPEIFL